MGHVKITTKGYLKETERFKIEALRQKKISGREIAVLLGRNHRTINREIKKATVELLNSDLSLRKEYRAHLGQEIHNERSKHKGPELKIGKDHELSEYIENKIKKEKYSPAAVLASIRNDGLKFTVNLSVKTIYNYVDKDVFYNLTNKDLLMRKTRKVKHRKIRINERNRLCKSIEERPEAANDRTEYGHWEIDCVKGKAGEKECLLTLSERMTRHEVIRKMKAATIDEVDKVLTKIEKSLEGKFKDVFKTITADNGSEFLDWERLETSKLNDTRKRTNIYFAHAYSAFERGTNENSNRIIRRFVPKGTSIGPISNEYIEKVEKWMNNYPRKVIGYETAASKVKKIFTRKMPQLIWAGL